MASIKSHRPSEQTKTSDNNEHSFTHKVKEMAQSARKIFTHQQHQESATNNHTQNFPTSGTPQHGVKIEKTTKKKMKKSEGSGGNCMPKMREHVKNLKNKKNREDKRSDNSSSSDSDDEKKYSRKN